MSDSTPLVTRLDEHDTLEDRLRVHRTEGAKFWAKNWEEATHYQRFANGAEHWPAGDLARVGKSPNRAARLTFDRIAPILQTLGGRQIMQRHERAYLPRHPDAARQAEIITAVDRAMMSAADADQVESTAFKDGCGVQGLACVRWELDTLKERGGGILLAELPIWQVMADPEARGINLCDRAWHRYGRWMPQTEVRDRWPDEWERIRSNVGGASYVPQEEGTSSRIPWAGMAGNKPAEWYYPRGKSLWIEYEEWREKVTRWDVAQPADPTMSYADALAPGAMAPANEDGTPGGDPIIEVTYETSAELRAFKQRHRDTFDEAVPRDMVVARDEVQYKYAYICGDTTLETDLLPTGYWTIQFLTGFRYPLANEVRWKSLVSRLIDPQKWIDVMVSALIRNLQMSPKGLLFVEEGFFRNRNEALSAWAAPGGVIQVRRGGLTAGTPGYKWEAGGTNPYTGMVESLLQMYRDLIPELAGFNPGALGQLGGDLRRISGEVVRQVQDAAMTSNAELFDALRLHRREGGRIFLSFLRTFFEVDDIIRIVGEDVAYETVMEPATAPVMDPATGQPQTDPVTGEPVMQPLIDEVTGMPQMRPATDPATGEAVRRLVVPDKAMWTADAWKEIAVEDVVPSGDQLQSLWKALETSIQILLQPQPDTGLPLFTSDILTEIIPGIPAQVREKMRQQVKAAKLRTAMAAMQPQQQAAPEQAAAGGEAAGYTNGQGG